MAKENAYQVADWNGQSGERWVANQARLDAIVSVFGQAAIEAAAPMTGERVLDVGCGAGASDDAVKMTLEVGPLSRALADQPDDIRVRASAAGRAAFAGLPGERSVVIDGAAWTVMARNPAS